MWDNHGCISRGKFQLNVNGMSYAASFNKGKGREELLNFSFNPLPIPLNLNGYFVERVEINPRFSHPNLSFS